MFFRSELKLLKGPGFKLLPEKVSIYGKQELFFLSMFGN